MIEIKHLSKVFASGQDQVHALDDVNLEIADGDIYGIIGMSGAGKSTLVRCVNRLEKPTDGEVLINGTDITKLSEKQLRSVRKDITMIFQGFNLLQQINCLKNVCFPLELAGIKKAEAEKKAFELLELVGLKEKAQNYPVQLSGGQQQRVAIARALATNPKVLLCDEATSALDPNTTNSILDLIKEINKKLGITVIVITHQMNVVERICNKVAILENGKVVEKGTVEEIFSHPKSEAGRLLVYPDAAKEENLIINSVYGLKVLFNGADAANKPLVASLAQDKGIAANIAYASTKSIGEKAYGTMILSFESEADKNTAFQYISKVESIVVEDLKQGKEE